MSRYTGPSWKLSRRLGISLSGTGKELEKHFPCEKCDITELSDEISKG